MGFMEVSAKTGVNVEEVFEKLAREVNTKREQVQREMQAGGMSRTGDEDENPKGKCAC